MKNYIIYFQIYGKKLKIKKLAISADQAKAQIKEDIKFDKIEVEKNENEIINHLKNILGIH